LKDLVFGFEQEGLELSFGEGPVEVKEGAVFGPPALAGALFLAAFEQSLQEGGVEHLRWQVEGAQKVGLAFA
jgi:hypothetical protein